jgi:Peptidase M1 N-terminal domain
MRVPQFEAHDARRMFPGWDEPVFKASEGARYQAAKAAENIQEQFVFKSKLLPPLAQWLRVS